MNLHRRKLLLSAGALTLSSQTKLAVAQAPFPSKPVRLVVPFAPGGANDILGRLLAAKMTTYLGQPVVVDNKAGAGGAIGAREVARAEPDGHTILLHSSSIVIQQHLIKAPGYDFRADFTPITMLTTFPLVLVVHPSVPARTMPEFLSYARSQGSKLFYGSAGNGATQHLVGELFNKVAGTKMQHVPYRGNGPATAALLAGDIQVFFDIIPTALSLGESGKVRPLAVTSMTRNPSVPNLPTMHESGVTNFESITWQALFLPKGAPAAVVQRWGDAAKRALSEKDVQSKLVDLGFTGTPSTPEQLAATANADAEKWGKVIADAQIKIDG